MKSKLIKSMVFMLLIVPTFSFITVADSGPELKIHITGSLPLPLFSKVVGGVIGNFGDAPAYNISYIMTVKGGIGDTIDETNQGYEKEILPGNALGVGMSNIYGFGLVIITIIVSTSNAGTVSATAKGFQIGGFTWVPLSWILLFINS